jgi:hypothetical protein
MHVLHICLFKLPFPNDDFPPPYDRVCSVLDVLDWTIKKGIFFLWVELMCHQQLMLFLSCILPEFGCAGDTRKK